MARRPAHGHSMAIRLLETRNGTGRFRGRKLESAFARIQRDVDAVFDALLPLPDDTRRPLFEAMRYAAMDGGKRVRPLLLVATAEMLGVARDPALRAGCAVEAIHVYSLIHDDLAVHGR